MQIEYLFCRCLVLGFDYLLSDKLLTKTHKEMKQKNSTENSLEIRREIELEMDYQEWMYFGADSMHERPVEIAPIELLKQLRDSMRELGC